MKGKDKVPTRQPVWTLRQLQAITAAWESGGVDAAYDAVRQEEVEVVKRFQTTVNPDQVRSELRRMVAQLEVAVAGDEPDYDFWVEYIAKLRSDVLAAVGAVRSQSTSLADTAATGEQHDAADVE